jgi:hypothetical protein
LGANITFKSQEWTHFRAVSGLEPVIYLGSVSDGMWGNRNRIKIVTGQRADSDEVQVIHYIMLSIFKIFIETLPLPPYCK